MAVILPFWTAFLIRIYAWINILQREGLLNDALIALGLINEPIAWLATDTAVYHRHRLFLSAVHGAAALCGVRENGRIAAGSRRRSRLPALDAHSGW